MKSPHGMKPIEQKGGCESMWEYKTETFNSILDSKTSLKRKSDEILRRYGKEGWELVNFQCIGALGSITMYVFKRLKEDR